MSTILNTNGDNLQIPELNKKVKGKFYVITARWNQDITYALRDGACDVLNKAGIDSHNIKLIVGPGTVELVYAAALAVHGGVAAAVIVIGCVI